MSEGYDSDTEPRKLPKYVYLTNNNKFFAQVCIDGKLTRGPSRTTVAEAVADAERMKLEQREAKVRRKQEKQAQEAALRETHAAELQTNMDRGGGNQDADRLSRDFVTLALRGSDVVAVSGVEYSKDMHLFRSVDGYGFDPALDVEPDDAVPTLVVELKSTSRLSPSNGKMQNPTVEFQGIAYADERATIVLMMYIPPNVTEATAETLQQIKFWWRVAFGWRPKNGVLAATLYGGGDPSKRAQPGRLLMEVLRNEVHRRAASTGGLLPYGVRKRTFKHVKHAKGQAVIDAIELQVLLPIGARFLPPINGGEGGAEDRRIAFSDGTVATAQVKSVKLRRTEHRESKAGSKAGFKVGLHRSCGSFRVDDASRKSLFRPYSQGENDYYLFGVLDPDGVGLAEYWAATESDMLGNEVSERLITDLEGNVGVTGITVHPYIEDKERLGDTAPCGASVNDHPERTRTWIRKLGPIMPLAEAQALKAAADVERRAQRLAAKAARAAAASATSTGTDDAGPSTAPTPTKRPANATTASETAEARNRAQRLRSEGDLRGWFRS